MLQKRNAWEDSNKKSAFESISVLIACFTKSTCPTPASLTPINAPGVKAASPTHPRVLFGH
jgi:hypothetical protein